MDIMSMNCQCEKSLETGCCISSNCLGYMFFHLGQLEKNIGPDGSFYKASNIADYIRELNNKNIYTIHDLTKLNHIPDDLIMYYNVSKDIEQYMLTGLTWTLMCSYVASLSMNNL